MPALTIDATTYPCRIWDKTQVSVSVMGRTWGDTMVSSRPVAAATVPVWDVQLRVLTESQKDTITAALLAAGTVTLAGDLPGGSITARATNVRAKPIDRQSRWEVDFVAEQVTP